MHMEKFFNTAGPIQQDIHYCVDPLSRIELDEIEMLFMQRKYFVLHAPRQTGKTSTLLALRDYLNKQGRYICVYANVEGGQAARNDVESVVATVCTAIASRTDTVRGNREATELYRSYKDLDANSRLTEFLKGLTGMLAKPLVLFLDEIDALVGDSLVSVLRQLRAGYDQRPEAFPQSIVLCGIRDVRDYRIVLSNQDIITGGYSEGYHARTLAIHGNHNFPLYIFHSPLSTLPIIRRNFNRRGGIRLEV